MTRTAKWSAATVLVIILLFVAAWFLLISPKRAAAAEVREQTVAQDAANALLESKIEQLAAQAEALPKHRAHLKVMQTQLMPTPGLPALIRALDKEAKASGVLLKALNPKAPVSGEAAAGPGGATLPSPGGAAAGPYLQEIALDIDVRGTFTEIQDFLTRIEDLKRVLLTTNVAVEVDEGEEGTFGPRISDPKLAEVKQLKMKLTSKVFMSTPGAPAAPDAGTAAPGAAVPGAAAQAPEPVPAE